MDRKRLSIEIGFKRYKLSFIEESTAIDTIRPWNEKDSSDVERLSVMPERSRDEDGVRAFRRQGDVASDSRTLLRQNVHLGLSVG
jgi:hypothetical protein